MPRPLPLLLAVSLLLSGCGYIGSPLPPLANVPSPVTGLAAVQRDTHIVVHFTLPLITTENMAIKPPLKLDLRIGPAPGGPFHAAWSLSRQSHTRSTGRGPGRESRPHSIPTGPWTGKSVIIVARVAGPNGKESNWAVLEPISVVPPPQKPGKPVLTASSTAGFRSMRVSWDGPAGDFRIFRRGPDEKSFAPVAEVQQTDWTDHASEFDKAYTYIVQRIVKLGIHQGSRESDLSEESSDTLVDKSLHPRYSHGPPRLTCGRLDRAFLGAQSRARSGWLSRLSCCSRGCVREDRRRLASPQLFRPRRRKRQAIPLYCVGLRQVRQ